MPEMEKGRPPENKRSRKPAHPVKREINQEMKVKDVFNMFEKLRAAQICRGKVKKKKPKKNCIGFH